MTLREASEKSGVNYNVLRFRVTGLGWPLEKAMSTPVQKKSPPPPGLCWSTLNKKLKKLGTVGFGLPAGVSASGFNTCPGKGICASWCYARTGLYVQKWVALPREQNLEIVRRCLKQGDAGMLWLTQEIYRTLRAMRTKPKSVRVHDSGDFFDQRYLDAWYADGDPSHRIEMAEDHVKDHLVHFCACKGVYVCGTHKILAALEGRWIE